MTAIRALFSALFSDHNYGLIWKSKGFARLAFEARVPIIPVFGQNIREAYRCLGTSFQWVQALYEKKRIVVTPLYGGQPVKLRTIVGQQIHLNNDMNVDQVYDLVIYPDYNVDGHS